MFDIDSLLSIFLWFFILSFKTKWFCNQLGYIFISSSFFRTSQTGVPAFLRRKWRKPDSSSFPPRDPGLHRYECKFIISSNIIKISSKSFTNYELTISFFHNKLNGWIVAYFGKSSDIFTYIQSNRKICQLSIPEKKNSNNQSRRSTKKLKKRIFLISGFCIFSIDLKMIKVKI